MVLQAGRDRRKIGSPDSDGIVYEYRKPEDQSRGGLVTDLIGRSVRDYKGVLTANGDPIR